MNKTKEDILDGYECVMVKVDDDSSETMWERGCVEQAMDEYAKQQMASVLDYVLTMSDLGKITMCDGLFYWEEDKDGDQPLEAEDIIKLFLNNKTIGK